jgi:hypothetical protein
LSWNGFETLAEVIVLDLGGFKLLADLLKDLIKMGSKND